MQNEIYSNASTEVRMQMTSAVWSLWHGPAECETKARRTALNEQRMLSTSTAITNKHPQRMTNLYRTEKWVQKLGNKWQANGKIVEK